ncbi:MAG: 30S ribosomal protein S8 [Candidatus Eisenbacteria bacterium]|uniref:Small ribosomal subunit protein uS8 n=1 Tax=Eiseniibacteriota bacterium TaxID=2212470 RepID=A0A937XBM6_UNCEI|nr:30S ribosomal protein S8 [Candidatus Eisenbacteria bacterium]
MSVSDPIADFLTRIRNASRAKHRRVEAPASRLSEEIAKLLHREGYIEGVARMEDGKQGVLRMQLRYDRSDGTPVIEGLERVSTPGRRVYIGAREIPRVRGGLGTAILSTPRGVMTDREARQAGVGGELVARVW